jgi:hypothetical protein
MIRFLQNFVSLLSLNGKQLRICRIGLLVLLPILLLSLFITNELMKGGGAEYAIVYSAVVVALCTIILIAIGVDQNKH